MKAVAPLRVPLKVVDVINGAISVNEGTVGLNARFHLLAGNGDVDRSLEPKVKSRESAGRNYLISSTYSSQGLWTLGRCIALRNPLHQENMACWTPRGFLEGQVSAPRILRLLKGGRLVGPRFRITKRESESHTSIV